MYRDWATRKRCTGLEKSFRFHPLVLEDIVNVPQRPKVEEYDGQLLIISRMLRLTGSTSISMDVEQISIVLGKDYVLTFQERPGDVLEPIRKRLREGKGPIRKSGSDYLAYANLDTISDAYYPLLEELGDYLEKLEDHVLERATHATLRRLNAVKTDLLVLRRAIWPQRDLLNSLVRDENPLVSEPVRVYLRDTYDHCVQTTEVTEAYREMASGLMNTYLSVVSNRMNEVMKILTIMASIFIPLTFLADIYGMNFDNMPELHMWWSYPALLVVMGGTVLLMLIYFSRKGWIVSGAREAEEDLDG